MTSLTGIRSVDLKAHARRWWWCAERHTKILNKQPDRVQFNSVVALFDDATLAVMSSDRHTGDIDLENDVFKITEIMTVDRLDRIEVRPFTVVYEGVDFNTGVTNSPGYYTPRLEKWGGFQIVVLDKLGKQTPIYRPTWIEETKTANIAAEIRATLKEILGDDPDAREHGGDYDGFAL